MSGSWKIDRHFDYESVNYYYTNKIAAFPTEEIPVLPTIHFASLEDLAAQCREVAAALGLTLPKCDPANMFLWATYLTGLPTKAHSNAWKFREYIFGCAMIFVGQYIEAKQALDQEAIVILAAHPRPLPHDFNMGEHTFTIVGSSELTSDIDITIQGPTASFLISVLEDIFISLTIDGGVPIRCWDVEFYGDFHLLQSLFVNFHKFSNTQRILLLKYAIVSYFRSTHQIANVTPSIHPNVQFLIRYCLKLAGVTEGNISRIYSILVNNAYQFWRTTAPQGRLNRELFYRDLFSVESDSAFIEPFMIPVEGVITSNNEKITNAGSAINQLAFSMFSTLVQANIHRAESYVLPSTAIHVVEFEQKKVGKSTLGLPDSWFASNARVGIDAFGFLLSAIEQLGYLEHYHHSSDIACNKKGIKYFGRYVRALVQGGLLEDTTSFTNAYKELNTFRSIKDPHAVCKFNIHDLLNDILVRIGGSGGGGRRRTRRRRRA